MLKEHKHTWASDCDVVVEAAKRRHSTYTDGIDGAPDFVDRGRDIFCTVAVRRVVFVYCGCLDLRVRVNTMQCGPQRCARQHNGHNGTMVKQQLS